MPAAPIITSGTETQTGSESVTSDLSQDHLDELSCDSLAKFLKSLDWLDSPKAEVLTCSGLSEEHLSQPIDIVISGGGLRGYYVDGAWSVLQKTRGLKIGRIAGASAGAWCAVFMACGKDPLDWARTYIKTQRLCKADGVKLLDAYRLFDPDVVPENAHVLCSGRVFISLTVVENGLLKNLIVNEFESREDLLSTAIASCQLPFVSTKGFGRRWRGRLVLDGGLTNNLPVFNDEISKERAQLLFHLSEVPYPITLSMSPTDSCIEGLILRGAVEMRRTLDSGTNTKSIEWLRPRVDLPPKPTRSEALRVTLKWIFLIVLILPFYAIHKFVGLFQRKTE